MRWKTKAEKFGDWHDWFAWHPVKVMEDKRLRWIWLETVSRRGELVYGLIAPLTYRHFWSWEYKLK